MKLILGSTSKFKKKVLEEMGYDFEVVGSDVDEMTIRSDDYYELPLLLARAKAENVVKKISEPAVILAADIVVICDGVLYEKPQSEQEARSWLKKYSDGHPAETACGVVAINTKTGDKAEAVEICKVYFDKLSEEVIQDFIDNGDPYSKAGGFSLQLPILKPYIKKLEGTVEGMVGMPTEVVRELIAKVK